MSEGSAESVGRIGQAKVFSEELRSYYGVDPSLAVFGLGFAMCFCYSSQRLASNIFDGWFQIAQYCGMVAAGLAFALYALRKRENSSARPYVRVLFLAACVLVCPFIVIPGPWSHSMPLMLALAAVDGAAFVWLCMAWGEFYARLGIRQALMCVCGFLMLSSIVKVFYDLLGHDVVGAVMLAALPVASILCLRTAEKSVAFPEPAEARFARGKGGGLGALKGVGAAMFIVVMGVALCMSATSTVFGLPFGYRVASQAATIAISALALFAAYRTWGGISPFRLWYIVVLVIASGLAIGVIVNAPLESLSSAIFTTAQMLSIGFVWLALADVAHRCNEASDLVFGFGWGMLFSLPMALGLAIPHAIPEAVSVPSLMVVVLWLLLVALTFLQQRQSPDQQLFVDFSPQVSEEGALGIDDRLAALGKEYGLTEREREIIGLYAQGRSRSFIGTELVISENTVRDHIKNVYRKLGIHNKQELIDLIE